MDTTLGLALVHAAFATPFATWLLKDEYPNDITVWLVEGESFEPGAPLTSAVQASVERIADAIEVDVRGGIQS